MNFQTLTFVNNKAAIYGNDIASVAKFLVNLEEEINTNSLIVRRNLYSKDNI